MDQSLLYNIIFYRLLKNAIIILFKMYSVYWYTLFNICMPSGHSISYWIKICPTFQHAEDAFENISEQKKPQRILFAYFPRSKNKTRKIRVLLDISFLFISLGFLKERILYSVVISLKSFLFFYLYPKILVSKEVYSSWKYISY